jgi:hypothetical protein
MNIPGASNTSEAEVAMRRFASDLRASGHFLTLEEATERLRRNMPNVAQTMGMMRLMREQIATFHAEHARPPWKRNANRFTR